ncbi:MAG: GspJ family type II secretion system protein [Desulfuromonadales bacterium]|nr:GspJ family type II secretion system protein [Desulfuromonadales bacterium]
MSQAQITYNRSIKGFTLLEVLIVMLLLVIIAGALYGTYFGLIKGRDNATQGMESRRELRNTLDMLRRELSSIIYSSTYNNPSNNYTNPLHFTVEDKDIFGKPASTLTFTCIAPPSQSNQPPMSDQLDVRYELVQQGDNKVILTRQAKDIHYINNNVPKYPQMEDIESFQVECYDGSVWVKSWDAVANNGLPKAVRVTITVKEGDNSVSYVTVATPRIAPL